MSIENLKKILESEKAEGIKQFWEFRAFKAGHEAATNRLLPLLQRAVEMADNIAKTRYGAQGYYEENDMIGLADYYERECSSHQQKAREFLAEFTKMAEIKKEGL